ncbi:hypothetical protein BOX15_Mlig005974g2 [Macrostomum lignano]|uniref:Integrase catalytic domain-containing protein n=1 Tax=Macrostomum lignano TaxID=282301 RepID=A0A267G5T3_9PLAT|nr:hypothetical protein BOX15_Mlig005974g2 [Macrostomum lignano]
MISEMTGAKYFSTFDAKSGFHQVQLDQESSLLTAFHTPFGVYKWNRLAFGLKDAPKAYQRRIKEEVTSQVEKCANYIDDIIVWGKTREEHDQAVRNLLEQCRKKNLTLNRQKTSIGKIELRFLGHILTDKGVKVDPQKVNSIKKMPHPNSFEQRAEKQAQLQRFIGSANYLSRFIANFSALTSPLRELMKKESEWVWTNDQEKAYQGIKQCLCEAPVLAPFDPNKDLILSVDASKDGLGAALLQEGHVIEYASSALTSAQKKYAQIEKEMLAIVFGCRRFRQYLWGRRVSVESDHKPLQYIMKKPMDELSARIQRLILKIQEFDLDVQYKPGRYLYLADTLSRAFLQSVHSANDIDSELENQILGIQKVCLPEDLLKKIQEHTYADSTCHAIKNLRNQLPEQLKPFWNVRHDLAEHDRLIMKTSKIFIPLTMRHEFLNIIHEGHQGIEKTLLKARGSVYWPQMRRDIQNYIAACDACQSSQSRPQKETIIQSPHPDYPFQECATDLFDFKGRKFIVLVDRYRRWICADPLRSNTAEFVILQLKKYFSTFGTPEKLRCDNGPPFSSNAFQLYAKSSGIALVTSSPRYPQSNGLAERAVQTVKFFLRKNEDFEKAMLHYRNTPIERGLPTPAELLMGRKLRYELPVPIMELIPKGTWTKNDL